MSRWLSVVLASAAATITMAVMLAFVADVVVKGREGSMLTIGATAAGLMVYFALTALSPK